MAIKIHYGKDDKGNWKTFTIKVPDWLKAKSSDTPVSIEHGRKSVKDHYDKVQNTVDQLNSDINKVGRTRMETEVFGESYND